MYLNELSGRQPRRTSPFAGSGWPARAVSPVRRSQRVGNQFGTGGAARRVRRRLAEWQSDLGVEARIWQHSALLSDNSGGAAFDAEQLPKLIDGLRGESESLLQTVVECVKAFRAGSYEGLWFAEIMCMSPEVRRLIAVSEQNRARRWFESIEKGSGPPRD